MKIVYVSCHVVFRFQRKYIDCLWRCFWPILSDNSFRGCSAAPHLNYLHRVMKSPRTHFNLFYYVPYTYLYKAYITILVFIILNNVLQFFIIDVFFKIMSSIIIFKKHIYTITIICKFLMDCRIICQSEKVPKKIIFFLVIF